MARMFRPGSSFLAACLPVLFTTALGAQIPLGGSLSGTLAPGVYHTTSTIRVDQNQVLTLPAGVIVKFAAPAHEFTIDGTLIVNGVAGNPVVFTDDADDSAGGNTNGGGASVGSPGSWRGLVFGPTASASSLTHADIRFGGSSFISNLELNGCHAVFTNCVVRNCFTHGMDLNGISRPVVTNCTFTDNGGFAIESAPITALPGFSGNSATGNQSGASNYARITNGAIAANLTIGPAAMISGACVLDTTATVGPGAVLTLQPGLVVKFRSTHELTVDGTLLVNGTAANPVVFTDDADDTAGGDTNGGGASIGASGSWRGIVFNSGAGGSSLVHADVRFGGSGFVSNLELNGCNPTFQDCVVRNCFTHGMDLNGTSRPVVTNCTFTDNGGFAIESAEITALPGFAGNSATGNQSGSGNYARVTVGAVTANLTIGPAAMISGAVVLDTTTVIAPGATLTLQAGLVCKFRSTHEVTVDGTLIVNGAAGNPVIFTDDADDSAGGNTNGGGASVGVPGSWRGIVFQATAGASSLVHADVRFGGSGFVSNLELNGCNPSFQDCVLRSCFSHGMDLNGTSRPVVTNCMFTNNGGLAIENVPIAAVPGFTNNTASGNGGNFVRITDGTVTGTLRIGPQCVMNGGLVLANDLTVALAGVLTLEQGVIFKCQNTFQVTVDGAIDVRGTAFEPVVFTTLLDDEHGGDTNGNGPSSGAAGAWRGVVCNAAAGNSRFENVLIRFAGSGFVPGLTSSSPAVSLRAVRVDRAFGRGFALGALAADAIDLVAWQCGNHGIHLTNGGFDVVHATCAGNATGIRREAGWTGSVINSISRSNATNFANFGAGAQVIASNGGFAGNNGNLDVDPLFVDATTGNLHLQLGSPCLGAANVLFAFAVAKDFDENSRVLDHALTGVALPDMGAFELPAWTVAVTGAARPGVTLQFTANGPAGLSFWVFGFLDGVLPVLPYGIVLAGVPGPGLFVMGSFVPVGTPQALAIPNDAGFVGLPGGIQSLTVPVANIGVGNVTQLYRLLIRP